MIRDKAANAIVFRRYENELRDSVYGQLVWAASKLGIDGNCTFNVSPMQIVFNHTGQKIMFKGADKPGKLKSINLGEGYVKYAWFEELDQFGGMEEIRVILQSLFRGGNQKRVGFYSYNPPKSARSWVNKEAKVEHSGRIVHHSDYRQIPAEWIGERAISDAEILLASNETAYRHEYLGEEVGTGLEVFNNIILRKIDDEEMRKFDHIYQGLDFGYATNPLAFERMHFNATRRKLYMFFELSGVGISNRRLAEMLPIPMRTMQTVADSAEPKSIDDLRRDHGMYVVGAKKGPGSVEHGIKFLADLSEIIIDPQRCPLAAAEFVNYALQLNRAGETIDRYPDKDNHSIDATRYALESVSKTIRAGRTNATRLGL
jgi:phage terminase large subunit